MKYFSPALLDGSVTTAKIADNAVTNAKMADFSINNAELFSRAVHRPELDTSEVSLAGTIGGGVAIDLVLNAYAFWPMFHVEGQIDVVLTGHSTDSPGSDNPRFGFFNSNVGSPHDYDVDYRHVDP